MSVTKRVVSGEHRFLYGNAFRLKVSDNDIAVTISNQHAFGDDDGITYVDEATIMMTPRSLKVLSIVLTNAIEDYEKQFGAVSLPAGFEEKLAADMSNKKRLTE